MESCPERDGAITVRCRSTLINIPELWIYEAVQDFLRRDAFLETEIFQSTHVLKSEFRKTHKEHMVKLPKGWQIDV
jgi:hypothetical protein